MSLPEKELEKALCCNQTCKKDLPFCKHYCQAICHKGPCPEPTECKERVTVRCKCKTRSETWECSRAQKARKALRVKDTGYLTLLECNEMCRKRREAEEAAKKNEEAERERRRREEEEELRAAKEESQRNRRRRKEMKADAQRMAKEPQNEMGMYTKIGIAVGLLGFFIALIVYMTSNSY